MCTCTEVFTQMGVDTEICADPHSGIRRSGLIKVIEGQEELKVYVNVITKKKHI